MEPSLPGGDVPAPAAVCLCTPSLAPSGMGAHMVDLARELSRTSDVSVLCVGTDAGRDVLARAQAVGARTTALPHPRAPGFGAAVQEHLARHPAAVFHQHVGHGMEDFDGARAARSAGVPTLVQTLHLPWLLSSLRKRRSLHRALGPVDAVIVVSQAQRRTYERIGIAPARITTVTNGVAPRGAGPGRAAARALLGLDQWRPVVLTAGRLTDMKGHRHLVAATPLLRAVFPDVCVVIVGDGHLRERLAAQARALGLDGHVRLVGHRPDVRMLLDAADVFALPSLHEGMPLAAIEAMDAGLPVVATRVIGSSEVVEDGASGLLVPPGDERALAQALGALLADAALRGRLGAAGRERYERAFTSARMAADTVQVYASAAAAAPSPSRR